MSEIIRNEKYWECGCEESYIHEDGVQSCGSCGGEMVDSPVARAVDVVKDLKAEFDHALESRDELYREWRTKVELVRDLKKELTAAEEKLVVREGTC